MKFILQEIGFSGTDRLCSLECRVAHCSTFSFCWRCLLRLRPRWGVCRPASHHRSQRAGGWMCPLLWEVLGGSPSEAGQGSPRPRASLRDCGRPGLGSCMCVEAGGGPSRRRGPHPAPHQRSPGSGWHILPVGGGPPVAARWPPTFSLVTWSSDPEFCFLVLARVPGAGPVRVWGLREPVFACFSSLQLVCPVVFATESATTG